MSVKTFSELIAWQKSMELVESVYQITRQFPKTELYSLTCQVRKASISVPSNIAEGQAQGTTRAFIKYLGIAYGSLCEVQTQLYIAARLGYLKKGELEPLIDRSWEVGRLINGLLRALRNITGTDH